MDEKNDLTQGSILKKLTRFFFPILFGMLFQQLYNTVDAIVVGRCIGPEALAAVGGSPAVITNLVIGFFTGLGAGATVIISQYYGSHEATRLSESVHTIICFCVLVGVAVSIFGWVSAPWSLRLVKTPADITVASSLYLRIYYLGASALLLFNIGSGVLRAVGDSRWPLLFLGICCGINIALDLLFVALLDWGVAGVAWATVLSQLISAVCVLMHLHRAKGPCCLKWRELRISSSALKRILLIGIPAAVQSAMYSLSNIIIQASVNEFGTVAVAAWTAVGKFDGIYWVTSNSFGAAICTFVGQCFGAGKFDRMRQGIRQWLLVDMGVTAVAMGVLLGLGRWGFRLFADDPAVLNLSVKILWYFVPFCIVWVFIEILSNALRGAGDSLAPMLICLVGVCVLRVLWIVIVVPHWHTIQGVSFSYPLTWSVTAVVFLLYYFRGNWLSRCMHQKVL